MKTMMSGFLSVILILITFYVLLMLFLYFRQASFVFFPNQPSRALLSSPADIGLQYQDVMLQTKDKVKLHAWFVPNPNAKAVVLICHGNAGNISHRLDTIKTFYDMGLAVFIFDYRGYGQSEGRESEKGTYLDARAAFDYLLLSYKAEQIALFGRSLGGAVASELATKVSPAVLILESTFRSVPDMGAEHYPFLPVRLLSRIRYDTYRRLPQIKVPVFILHSPDDETIPYTHGRALYEVANEPKQFMDLRGDHNGGFLITSGYAEEIKRFLLKYISL